MAQKRFIKMGISLTLATGLLLSGWVAPASVYSAAPEAADWLSYFPDDLEGHWAKEHLSDYVQAGILQGNTEGDRPVLRPDASVTRAEFVTILMRAMGEKVTAGYAPGFADVERGSWYYEPIAAAKEKGLVNGVTDRDFAPERTITRAEIAAIMVRALLASATAPAPVNVEGAAALVFRDIAGHWAKAEIQRAAQAGIVNGYEGGLFAPGAKATRAEAAVMVRRGLQQEKGRVPEDSELIRVLESSRSEELASIKAGQAATLMNRLTEWYTGFYLAAEATGVEMIRVAEENGVKVSFVHEGVPKWKVISKSDRYATVELSGLTSITTFGEGEGISQPVDDTFLLRKLGNQWYVYGVIRGYEEWRKEASERSGASELGSVMPDESFYLDIEAQDAVMHPSKPVLYTIDSMDNTVNALNYDTEKYYSQSLEATGEKLFATDKLLYVAETVGEHSSYWWEEDQLGYVTVLDTETLEFKGRFQTAVDPYDIVADKDGYIYVTSGSGQWTYIESYEPAAYQKVAQTGIRQQSRLAYDPVKNRIYAVDSDSSPRDFEMFALDKGQFKAVYDSPYHGDFPLQPWMRISPDGKYIFNGQGNVFRSAYAKSSDMTHVTNLEDGGFLDIAFDADGGQFFTIRDGQVSVYDDETMKLVGSFDAGLNAKYVFYRGDRLFTLGTGIPEGYSRPVWVWNSYSI